MTRRTFLHVVAAVSVLAACATKDRPTDPAWGKEPCAHCSMVLSERRFGAQLLTTDGDRFFFDDPGCMVVFIDERGLRNARAWVYDDGSRRWIDASTARYANGAATPMDFGFEANDVGPLSWNDVHDRVLQKARAAR